MSRNALMFGHLYRDPERRVSKVGKNFIAATLREGKDDDVTCRIISTQRQKGNKDEKTDGSLSDRRRAPAQDGPEDDLPWGAT
jgi:hypothetical protein